MIYYIRDEEGSLIGFKYNDEVYYYIKNMQEDIIGITDENYNLLCTYEYDSWGKVLSIKNPEGNLISDPSHIGYLNLYRYRSYYYDAEIGLYYLNSRYYNPEWGRFINIDSVSGEIGNVLSHNMYKYANNNPINFEDDKGDWPKWLKKAAKKIAIGAAAIAVGAAVVAISGVGTVSAVVALGVKTAVTVGVVGAATRGTIKGVQSAVKRNNIKTIAKDVGKAAIEGFASGFETGGFIGGAMGISSLGAHSNGIKIGETAKSNYGRVTIGYGSGHDKGMTLINYSNKNGKSRFRLDIDSANGLHMHYGRTKSQIDKHRKTITDIIFGIMSGL